VKDPDFHLRVILLVGSDSKVAECSQEVGDRFRTNANFDEFLQTAS
jgi:hypothetical protein